MRRQGVGGWERKLETFHYNFTLCTFRYDPLNHWYVILRNRLQYVSVEKCRDGITVQISRNKDELVKTLMGASRLPVRRNRDLQAAVNMPSNLSVSLSVLVDILAAGIEEGYMDMVSDCQDFCIKIVR